MDLSKLYRRKELTGESKEKIESVFIKWKNNSLLASAKNVKYSFSNIQMEEIPVYLFNFAFQNVERNFYEKEKPASEKEKQLYKESDRYTFKKKYPLSSFTFDSVPLDEHDFDDESNTKMIIDYTKTLIECDDCVGVGTFVCPDCHGKHTKYKCPECHGKGELPCHYCKGGYIKCDNCGGKGYNSYNGNRCKKCYGDGKIACPKCNTRLIIECDVCGGTGEVDCDRCGGYGYIDCETCEGSGYILKYITVKDTFSIIENNISYPYVNNVIPKKVWESGVSLTEHGNVILFRRQIMDEFIDTPQNIMQALEMSSFTDIKNCYSRFYGKTQQEYEGSSLSKSENIINCIIKAKAKIEKVSIYRVSYECNSQNFEAWINDKDEVFVFDSPFMKEFQTKENLIKIYIKNKQYAKAIEPLEELCKYAEINQMEKEFKKNLKLLDIVRRKVRGGYIAGISLGTILLVGLFFIFPKLFLSITDGEMVIWKWKGVRFINFFIDAFVPIFSVVVIFIKLVRNKINNKYLRIILPISIPLLYNLFFLLLHKANGNAYDIYFIINLSMFVFCIFMLFVIQIPYGNIITSEVMFLTKNKNNSEESDKTEIQEPVEEESKVSLHKETKEYVKKEDFVSSKHRILAALLCFLLGFLGIHRFYAGRKATGLLYILIFIGIIVASCLETKMGNIITYLLVGTMSMWYTVDLILIFIGQFKDKNGAKLKQW